MTYKQDTPEMPAAKVSLAIGVSALSSGTRGTRTDEDTCFSEARTHYFAYTETIKKSERRRRGWMQDKHTLCFGETRREKEPIWSFALFFFPCRGAGARRYLDVWHCTPSLVDKSLFMLYIARPCFDQRLSLASNKTGRSHDRTQSTNKNTYAAQG